MAMRIAPPPPHPHTHSHVTAPSSSAPSAPGLYDTLRAGVGPLAKTITCPSSSQSPVHTQSSHPLEARLAAWTSTQESIKQESLRRTFGLAEPIRRGMELKTVREGSWRPACLGGGLERSVQEDILMGSDASIEWEDVFKGEGLIGGGVTGGMGFHEELDRKIRMQ